MDVILSSPLALCLLGIALFLCLFDKHYQATKGVFSLLSGVIALGTGAYLLTLGASAWLTAGVLLIFLLLNMGVRE